MKTLILQSTRLPAVDWIAACIDSVKMWCDHVGYDHQLIGDEIFDCVPPWYMNKVVGKLPVATDYARLIHIKQRLSEGWDRVVWIDADVIWLDFDWPLPDCDDCAFGAERWVQPKSDKGWKVCRNVHNAICVFTRGSVTLDFLAKTVLGIIEKADPEFIAPQMVGPKLLTALHNIVNFQLLPEIGALSPWVIDELLNHESLRYGALARLRSAESLNTTTSAVAYNLCASLNDDQRRQNRLAHLCRDPAYFLRQMNSYALR